MSWIFDNLQIVIVVGSTIAWWLTQRKQGEEETPPPTDRPGRRSIDVDQMERNRRLREEIRRKREQRRTGDQGPATQMREREEATRRREVDVPDDVTEQIPPVLRELMGIPEPRPRAPAPAPPPIPEVNPVSERQQRMQDEIAALEAKRRAADAKAAKFKANMPQRRRRRQSSADSLSDRDFLATLRDPRQARRAVVLREVLSKPLALRGR